MRTSTTSVTSYVFIVLGTSLFLLSGYKVLHSPRLYYIYKTVYSAPPGPHDVFVYTYMRAWALPLAQAASLAAGPSAGSRGTSLRVISSRDSSGESEAYRVPRPRLCTGDGTVPGAAALGGRADTPRGILSPRLDARFFVITLKAG